MRNTLLNRVVREGLSDEVMREQTTTVLGKNITGSGEQQVQRP